MLHRQIHLVIREVILNRSAAESLYAVRKYMGKSQLKSANKSDTNLKSCAGLDFVILSKLMDIEIDCCANPVHTGTKNCKMAYEFKLSPGLTFGLSKTCWPSRFFYVLMTFQISKLCN